MKNLRFKEARIPLFPPFLYPVASFSFRRLLYPVEEWTWTRPPKPASGSGALLHPQPRCTSTIYWKGFSDPRPRCSDFCLSLQKSYSREQKLFNSENVNTKGTIHDDKLDFIKIKNYCCSAKDTLKPWAGRKYLQNTYLIKGWDLKYTKNS